MKHEVATMQQPSAPAELLERGHLIVKAENEVMSSIAIARPRELSEVKRKVFVELETFPRMAASAWYSIPYKDNSSGETKTVMVSGPSVRTARRLAQQWGNCAVKSRITGSSDEHVDIEGVALDLETNYQFSIPMRVSRWEKNRKTGQMFLLAEDRWSTKIASARSKAIRNAVFGIIPEALVDEYVERARQIAESKPVGRPADKGTAADQVRARFAKYDIPDEVLAGLVGLAKLDDLTLKHKEAITDLGGLFNALEDGTVTRQMLLDRVEAPDGAEPTPIAQSPTGTLTESEAGR